MTPMPGLTDPRSLGAGDILRSMRNRKPSGTETEKDLLIALGFILGDNDEASLNTDVPPEELERRGDFALLIVREKTEENTVYYVDNLKDLLFVAEVCAKGGETQYATYSEDGEWMSRIFMWSWAVTEAQKRLLSPAPRHPILPACPEEVVPT